MFFFDLNIRKNSNRLYNCSSYPRSVFDAAEVHMEARKNTGTFSCVRLETEYNLD